MWRRPTLKTEDAVRQRGDASAWIPFVIRHRRLPSPPMVLATASSWDATLAIGPQLRFYQTLGAPNYKWGAWYLSDNTPDHPNNFTALEDEATLSQNYGDGEDQTTAATFYWSRSGHVISIRSFGILEFEEEYPPLVPLENNQVLRLPLCGYHTQVSHALGTLLAGQPEIIPPSGDCETLYGAQ